MGKAKFSSTTDLPVTKDDMTQDDTLVRRSFFYSILLIRNDNIAIHCENHDHRNSRKVPTGDVNAP